MLTWLIEQSLRYRLLVVSMTLGVVLAGTLSLEQAKLDVFPEFAPPKIEVQTEAPGLSTEEVERLVSIPIESALTSIPFVQTLRSKSVLGLSSVVLILERGADLEMARQSVQERLSFVAARLPAASRNPVILPPLSSTSRVLKVGITSPTLSQMEMSELARWTIRPRLMAVPGVANVAIWGQNNEQVQVIVEPRRLAEQGVSLSRIVTSASNAVALGGGGFIDTPNQRLSVRHKSSVLGPEELKLAVVSGDVGRRLRLGDIASIQIGSPPPIGDAIINSQPGLLLIVEKYPWGNTLEVTRGVEAAFKELKPGLPDLDIDTTIFRPATFIEASLSNLSFALWTGCLLVVFVLLLFLADLRSALISSITIPVSLLTAVLIIVSTGRSINTMVIAGLAIALGSVVDDAIIDVENITRRLRLNAELDCPRPVRDVVLSASLEIRSSVVYASAIVVVTIVPVFFLDGLAGAFFAPLASTYVLAIAVSLIVALTLTPVLCSLLLRFEKDAATSGRLAGALKNGYLRLLSKVLSRPRLAVLVTGAFLVVSATSLAGFGREFLPHFKENDFLMHWVEKPGTSLEAMRRITLQVSDELLSIPGVRNFGSHIGRAEAADEVVGPNFTELWISIEPNGRYDEIVSKVKETIAGYPGLHRDVLTYLRERIKEVLSGGSGSIVIRISGPELAGLKQAAQTVSKQLSSIPGVAELKVEDLVLVPQLSVAMKSEKAAFYGLSEAEIRQAVGAYIGGIKVGEIVDGQAVQDVVVWADLESRSGLSALKELPIDVPGGGIVPLQEVANVFIEAAPNAILREGASRRIDVSCNVEGRDLASVAEEIKNKLSTIEFEAGYYPVTLGEYEAQEAAQSRLLWLGLLAVLIILVLLQSDLGRPELVAVVFSCLPLSLVGGVIGVASVGGVLSLGSLVGFVAVLGIAARNGIMLVSHYRHLQTEEGCGFGLELVLRGAGERLVPILMTALTTTLALLPIVLGGDLPGYEIEHPMAIVILGGMVSSTLLSLFILPSLYSLVGSDFTVTG